MKFNIFPTQASKFINIINLSIGDKVSLHNFLGQKILDVPVDMMEISLDVSHLINGIYILKVDDPQGRSRSTDLVTIY